MSGLTTSGLKASVAKGQAARTSLGTSSKAGRYVRVLKVILNESDMSSDGWKRWGYSQALYGLFYQELFVENKKDIENILQEEKRNFAYCGSQTLRRIPIKNEVVILDSVPDFPKSEERESTPVPKVVWTDIVAGWNHPALNQYPDIIRNGKSSASTGDNFTESFNINPLQLCPGDTTLEGRYGNSLRFGGTWYSDSPISKRDTNSKPYTILRNGQGIQKTRGDQTVYEDINKDACSIYLTDGQLVPLTQASVKHSAYNGSGPVQGSMYSGAQILLNSDRVFLNGKDNIQIVAKSDIGISANEVNLDGKTQVSLDADNIYLGTNAQSKKEPCLKGTSTTDMLSDILDKFNMFMDTIMSAPPIPEGFVGVVKTGAAICKQQLSTYQSQLKKLHSTKIFVE